MGLPNEITKESFEYSTFFAKTMHSEIERCHQLQQHSTSSPLSLQLSNNNVDDGLPLKKRKHNSISQGEENETVNTAIEDYYAVHSSSSSIIFRKVLSSEIVSFKIYTKPDTNNQEDNKHNEKFHDLLSFKNPALTLKWINNSGGKVITECGKCNNLENFLNMSTAIATGLADLNRAEVILRHPNAQNIIVKIY